MLKYFFSVLLLLVMPMMMAFAEEFVAGKDYVIIDNTTSIKNPREFVPVTEFFSYGCPGCYRIEAALNNWIQSKGNKIFYDRVPVVFKKDWEYYAKAYYTAQSLALIPQLTPELFKTILIDKQPLNSDEAMIAFFKSHGVDEAVVKSAFQHSPSITIELDGSKRLMASYQINAVPAIVVNHQYKTDLQMAKNEERLFAILNYLFAKASKETS